MLQVSMKCLTNHIVWPYRGKATTAHIYRLYPSHEERRLLTHTRLAPRPIFDTYHRHAVNDLNDSTDHEGTGY